MALVLVVSLYFISGILLILFLAIVISSAIDAPLNYLEKKRVPRILGLLFIFFAAVSVLSFLLYTIVPFILIEIKDLLGSLKNLEAVTGGFFGIPEIATRLEFSVSSLAPTIFSSNILNVIPQIFENILHLIVIIAASFYLAIDREGVERFLKSVLPLAYENYAIKLFHRVRAKMGKWLEGQIFLSLAIAIITFLGLKILGVKYSLVLGLLAGIFEIIPIVGPIVAGVLAFVVALSQSVNLAIFTAILFVVIQQLENHLLVPLIMKRTVDIHPVVVIFSIIIGGQLAGFIGVILAIPTVVVIQELLEDYARSKQRQPTL